MSPYDAEVLIADPVTADYFETVASGRDAKMAANWVMGELFAACNRLDIGISESPVSAEHLGTLIDLISDKTLSNRMAKDVFDIMLKQGKSPEVIVEEQGLKQVSDSGEIEGIIDEIIAANPKQVEQVKAKPKAIGWFVGQVMQRTGGKANPAIVNEVLVRKLNLNAD